MTATYSGTTISVSWAPVPCLQRNSEITGYVVRYIEVSSGGASPANVTVPGSVTLTTLDGLKESTQYYIEVAAVGAGVTGVFSTAVVAAKESEWQ